MSKLIPLILFLLLGGLLFVGLDGDPRHIPSPLIGKTIPTFELPAVSANRTAFSSKELEGKVSIINVWASDCVTCLQEHELLKQIAKEGIPIYGISLRDELPAAQRYLQLHGDPYIKSGLDTNGRVSIEWGIIATPETFVIDKKGIIRYKHSGLITLDDWNNTIGPMIVDLNKVN